MPERGLGFFLRLFSILYYAYRTWISQGAGGVPDASFTGAQATVPEKVRHVITYLNFLSLILVKQYRHGLRRYRYRQYTSEAKVR